VALHRENTLTIKKPLLSIFIILSVLLLQNCQKPCANCEILEGKIEANLRIEKEELDFIREKAVRMTQNNRGFWEAEFIHDIVMIYIPAGTFIMGNDELIHGHNIRADARQYDDPDSAGDHFGFRIAIDYIIR